MVTTVPAGPLAGVKLAIVGDTMNVPAPVNVCACCSCPVAHQRALSLEWPSPTSP
jgi:hypothetical protein